MTKRSYKRNYRHSRRFALIAARGGKCEVPNCPVRDARVLEFAHISPTGLSGIGRGSDRRYLDVEKNPGSYRLLCWQHHDELDGVKRGEDRRGIPSTVPIGKTGKLPDDYFTNPHKYDADS